MAELRNLGVAVKVVGEPTAAKGDRPSIAHLDPFAKAGTTRAQVLVNEPEPIFSALARATQVAADRPLNRLVAGHRLGCPIIHDGAPLAVGVVCDLHQPV